MPTPITPPNSFEGVSTPKAPPQRLFVYGVPMPIRHHPSRRKREVCDNLFVPSPFFDASTSWCHPKAGPGASPQGTTWPACVVLGANALRHHLDHSDKRGANAAERRHPSPPIVSRVPAPPRGATQDHGPVKWGTAERNPQDHQGEHRAAERRR